MNEEINKALNEIQINNILEAEARKRKNMISSSKTVRFVIAKSRGLITNEKQVNSLIIVVFIITFSVFLVTLFSGKNNIQKIIPQSIIDQAGRPSEIIQLK